MDGGGGEGAVARICGQPGHLLDERGGLAGAEGGVAVGKRGECGGGEYELGALLPVVSAGQQEQPGAVVCKPLLAGQRPAWLVVPRPWPRAGLHEQIGQRAIDERVVIEGALGDGACLLVEPGSVSCGEQDKGGGGEWREFRRQHAVQGAERGDDRCDRRALAGERCEVIVELGRGGRAQRRWVRRGGG